MPGGTAGGPACGVGSIHGDSSCAGRREVSHGGGMYNSQGAHCKVDVCSLSSRRYLLDVSRSRRHVPPSKEITVKQMLSPGFSRRFRHAPPSRCSLSSRRYLLDVSYSSGHVPPSLSSSRCHPNFSRSSRHDGKRTAYISRTGIYSLISFNSR